MTMKVQSLTDLQDRRIMLDRDVPPYGYAFVILVGIFMVFLLVWSTQTNRIYVSQNTGTVQASNKTYIMSSYSGSITEMYISEGSYVNEGDLVAHIKSNNAQPIGPIIQSFALGEDHQMHLYMMQQATQLIPQMDPGYHMDAILRVKNCLYAHYTGPLENSQLASYKLQVHAFENDQKLTGTSYTIYVNQDSDDAVIDVFMETK